MDTLVVDRKEMLPLVVTEASEDEHAAQKKNAPELATLGTFAVACATDLSTTEYTPEPIVCQLGAIPALNEIEATIAAAARTRIVAAHRELDDTRARLERERTAREMTLQGARQRTSQTKTVLTGLAGERTAMEGKAQAFLGGEELKGVLRKIHLAFNVRQLELESALAEAEAQVSEAETEAQAAQISDALELQLAEQELERLESAAPEVAEQVRLTLSAAHHLDAARQAIQDGMLRDAALLLEQAKAGGADAGQIADAEHELQEAQQKKLARDLIARINLNPDQPGATRRIHRLMEEAQKAEVAELVAPFANKALDTAREAAQARFLQARPIADHLASEGYVPVLGDGRIEAWREIMRNGNGTFWKLERILTFRGKEGWITEMPHNPVTQKELPVRVRHSRWYHAERANPTR